MPKKRVRKRDIFLNSLIYYNLLFFIPIVSLYLISNIIAKRLAPLLSSPVYLVTRLFMILFTFIIFMLIIPYIRRRENIVGVRYELFGFLIVGFFMTLPSLIIGRYGVLMGQLVYLSTYILLTFIYSPDVLGIDKNIKNWFDKSKQLIILLIYLSIVLFYIFGFAWSYYEIGAIGGF